MASIRLAIADDQKLFREGLLLIIQSFEGIDTCIEAENGRELIEALAMASESELPHVILLDMEMPEMDGEATIKVLRKDYPQINVLFLSMYHDENLIAHMMSLGAHGYLRKDEDSQVVEAAIRTVVEKGTYFNDYTSTALLNKVRTLPAPSGKAERHSAVKFTKREKEILHLLSQGKSRKEMAAAQFVTEKAIDFHLQNLKKKTGLKTSSALIKLAIHKGF
jgi:DNA-binding NarL/FixJ family response regulator